LLFCFFGLLAPLATINGQPMNPGIDFNDPNPPAQPAATSTPATESKSWYSNLNPLTWLKDAAATAANALIFAFALFPLILSAVLSDICAVLFKFFLLITTGGGVSYTGNPAVKVGWPLVRDLANMIIVLGFVIIGVATALRVREYEAKQLLGKLIIVALFVNFSLLICGVVIDASNILINFFAGLGDLSDYGKFFNSSAIKTVIDIAMNVNKDNPVAFLIKALSVVVFNLLLVVVISLYTFLFAFRIVAIWLLVILSPLAFVLSVFPATRKFYEMWINNFIQWCFVGVPATFFLYLAHTMQGTMAKMTEKLSFASFGEFSQSLTGFASLVVPAVFLIMGFLMTIQASSALAGGGLIRWAGDKSKKGGMALTKTLADKTGLSGAGNWAKDRAIAAGEALRLVKPGTRSRSQSIGLNDKDRQSRIDNMSAEQRAGLIEHPRIGHNARMDRAYATQRLGADGQLGLISAGRRDNAINESLRAGADSKKLISGMQSAEVAAVLNNPANQQFNNEARAEGFKTLSKRGDLDLVQATHRGAALQNAVTHGARIEDIKKADYHYAAQDQALLQRIRTANPGFIDAEINDAAIQQTLDEQLPNMPHEQLRNVDAAHWMGSAGSRRVQRLTPDKINAMQYAPQDRRNAIHDQYAAGGAARVDMENVYHEYEAATAAGNVSVANERYQKYREHFSRSRAVQNLP